MIRCIDVLRIDVLRGAALALLFGLLGVVQAQVGVPIETETYDSRMAVWRGFVHEWTYNHRLNRMGSRNWIHDAEGNHNDQMITEYAAASGTGTDSTYALAKRA